MLDFLKRKSSPPPVAPLSIRDTLFGDLPLSQWPSESAPAKQEEPWKSFVEARWALSAGRTTDAIRLWRNVLAMPQLESRHYLQAWTFLRANGVQPTAAEAKTLYGVVIEVPMEGGLDLLAAYPERNARYYNYTGAGVVWEHPDSSLDGAIDNLLQAGQKVLNAIGPWEGARPGLPPAGGIRLNFLSPAGLHFGQGPFQTLANEPMAKPVIDTGTVLMQRLTQLRR